MAGDQALVAAIRANPPEKSADILKLLRDFKEGEFTRIYPTTHFGYRKITVERPLRLNFQVSPERLEVLKQNRAFLNLAVSKKKDKKKKASEEAQGQKEQEAILIMLNSLRGLALYMFYAIFRMFQKSSELIYLTKS